MSYSCPHPGVSLLQLRCELVLQGCLQRLQDCLAQHIEVSACDTVVQVPLAKVVYLLVVLLEVHDCCIHVLHHVLAMFQEFRAVVEVRFISEREQL